MKVNVENYDRGITYAMKDYVTLKQSLFLDINVFCRNYTALRDSLHVLRLGIGQEKHPDGISSYLDAMKSDYNDKETNIGLDYRIELTRFDIAVCVTVVIKRTNITMRNFIFRYRRTNNAGEGAFPAYSVMGAAKDGGVDNGESENA